VLEVHRLIGHSLLRGLDDAQGLFWVAPPPLEKARPRDRQAHVLGDARLQPTKQAVGGCDRTSAQ